MKLKKLFDYYSPDEFSGNAESEIKGIATHTSEVKKGYLFFALVGEKKDGRNYAGEAVKKGASAIVSDSEVYVEGAGFIKVKDPLEALSKWSACFYHFPAGKLNITGVTGTNGKTTVTGLIHKLMMKTGNSGLIGTRGYFYGETEGSFNMTTPRPHELHRIFKDMLKAGVKNIAMEVSSHALELKRVEDIPFKSAVFTNLTQDHLDFHKTIENYYRSKLKLFNLLKDKKSENAIINIDDSYGKKAVNDIGFKSTTYGIKEQADFRALVKDTSLNGSHFTFVHPEGKEKMTVKLIGRFNIYNCLAAMTWGIKGGMDMPTVCKVISEAEPVPGRLEIIKKVDGGQKMVVVDYAHTPDALENILLTLREVKAGRLICVFGCGGDRDREKRPLMGKIAGAYSDVVYLTSDNPRSEDPMSIILDIELGLRDSETYYYVIPDREEAIKAAIENAQPGDCILLAGKGDEDYQIIGDKMIPFSDRLVARSYL